MWSLVSKVENLERIQSGRSAPRRGLTDSEKGWSGNTYIRSMLVIILTRLNMPLSVTAGMAWKQCSVGLISGFDIGELLGT